jgi:hypothetical protein
MVLQISTGLFVGILLQGKPPPPATTAGLNVGCFSLVLAIGLLWGNLSPARAFPLRPVPISLFLPMGLTIVGLSVIVSDLSNLVIWLLPPPQIVQDLFNELFDVGKDPWMSLVLLVVVAPLTEELTFRGLMLGGMLQRYRAWVAITLTAGLFALLHMNPWQFPAAMILGVLFGWWFLRTRSLWPCLFGHAVNNGLPHITTLVGLWEIEGYNTPMSHAASFQPAWFDLAGLGLCMVGLAGTWLIFRRMPVVQVARPIEPTPAPPAQAPPPQPDIPIAASLDPIVLQRVAARLASAERPWWQSTDLQGHGEEGIRMTTGTIRELFTYTDWARDKIFELAGGLSDEQLDRPFEMGIGSIRNTLHHVWAAERVWLDRWMVGGQPPFAFPEPGLPLAALLDRAKSTAAERDDFLAKQADADLAKPLTFTNIKGETYSLALGGQMMHVTNHGIHHRAQILNMVRRAGPGAPPLPQRGLDYIFFRLEKPASPPLDFETIRSYQDYSDWATCKLLYIASKLSDGQIDRKFEMGLGSIRDTFSHLRDAENWWYWNWTEGPGRAFPETRERTPIAELSRQLDEAWSKRDRFVDSLTEADVQRTIHAQPRPDRRVSFPLGVTMVQLCGHATHHRAQILNMLRHVGAETPGLDLVLWLREL